MSAQADRLDELQATWTKVQLTEVAKVVNGGTPKSKVQEYWGGNVQWLTPKEMGGMADRYISATERTITETGLAKSSARLVPPNSLILSTRAPIGHLAINHVEMAFNQGCRGIVPGADLDVSFLYYFLLAHRQQLNDLGTGTTFKELSATNLKAFQLPLPSLDEQKRIVAVLDRTFAVLDRARSYTEANLEDTREVFSRLLDQFFPSSPKGETTPLSAFIDIHHGYAFKSKDFETSENSALPIVLTPGNYSENGQLYFRMGKTKRLTSVPPEDFIFEKGDLSVVMTDLSPKMNILGKPAFITEKSLLHNQRIGRVSFLTDEVDPRFIYYFFRAKSFSDRLKSTATGTMVRHTAPKRILSCDIPNYSLKKQSNIADKLHQAQSDCLMLQQAYSEKAAKISSLRKSLLERAFAGELT